jgi:hypothetical protein
MTKLILFGLSLFLSDPYNLERYLQVVTKASMPSEVSLFFTNEL